MEQEKIDIHDLGKDDNKDREAMTDDVKIRLGTYTVDNSEQELCARGILGREVEKLQVAIEGCRKDSRAIRRVLLEHNI